MPKPPYILMAVKREWVPDWLWWVCCHIRIPAWEENHIGTQSRFGFVQVAVAPPFRWVLTRKPRKEDVEP